MLKDVVTYFIGKVFPAIFNLIISLLLIRELSGVEYGRYSLIFAGLMLFHNLTFGWIQQSMLRFISLYQNLRKIIINKYSVLTLFSSILLFIIVYAVCVFYFKTGFLAAFIIATTSALFNAYIFILTLKQAVLESKSYVITDSLFWGAYLAILYVILFLFDEKNYLASFWAMGISLLLIVAYFVFYSVYKSGFKISKAFFTPNFTTKTIQYGGLLTIWLFISYLFNITDRFLIKELEGYESAGLYSAIYDLIFKLVTFCCMPILLAFHPKITALWNEGSHQAALSLIKKAICLEVVALVIGIVVFCYSEDYLYSYILKKELQHMTLFAVTLLVSAFLWQIAMLVHKPLELLFKQKTMLIGIIISLIMNVVLNVVFIPIYGYQFAAYATCVSILVYLSFVLFYSKKNLKNEFRDI